MREKPGHLFVNLVNRAVSSTLTPRLHIVEEVPASGRLAERPQEVVLEPERKNVEWSYQDTWLTANINSIHIHDVVVIRL